MPAVEPYLKSTGSASGGSRKGASGGGPAPVAVDGQEAARTELAWWQARREGVPAEQYGAIIARVSTLLYGVDNGNIRRSGLLRAQAMDYRDAHSADMTEADWAEIEDRLRSAYGLLKKAASSPAR
jgi:hypothetical protein